MLPIFRERVRRAENIHQARKLREKRFALRAQSDPFSLPHKRFVELYRLNKRLVRNLINILRPLLPERQTLKGMTLETQVFAALRFYATGSYQRSVGQDLSCGLSQTSVHRCIHKVTDALEGLADESIKLPVSREERNQIKLEVMRHWGFPGVVGFIDGFHVAILQPLENEQQFINRKGYHSFNVQIVCDHVMKIKNIFANFGGATHDSYIWRMSQAQHYMRRINAQNERCWLLGDSGYPLQPYLMTPFRNPHTDAQNRFNQAHIRARNIIERTIGLLKMRFRCLLKERVARYCPNVVCKLVKVFALLHNWCVEENLPFDYQFEENADASNVNAAARQDAQQPEDLIEGINMRNLILNQYF